MIEYYSSTGPIDVSTWAGISSGSYITGLSYADYYGDTAKHETKQEVVDKTPIAPAPIKAVDIDYEGW